MKLLRLASLATLALLGIAAATATPVDCANPVLHSTSPDARHTLAICPGERLLPLPTRPPAHAVLRNQSGRIEGVVAIAADTAIPPLPAWGERGVEMPKLARIDYSHGSSLVQEGFWRLRTWLRAIPRDEEFR